MPHHPLPAGSAKVPKHSASSPGPPGSPVAAKRAHMKSSTPTPRKTSGSRTPCARSTTSCEDEEDKEEQDEQVEPAGATAEVQDRVDLIMKQIKSIVPKARGSKKKDVQRSAMEVTTHAQVKELHKRLGFSDNTNMQAVRSNIAHLWFAAQ